MVEEYLNHSSKDEVLMDLLDAGVMPNPAEWEMIYQCTLDQEVGTRSDAAEILGIRCNEKDEEKLCRMAYDKADELVRVCAVQSLQMGRQEKTLKCLYELMRTGGRMARGYAVRAFYEVWVNRNGYTKESVRKCWRKMAKLYKKEKSPWVLAGYEGARYQCGCERGLLGLKKILCEGRGLENVQSVALGQLMYLRNVFNEHEINLIIEETLEYMDVYPWIREKAQKFLEEKEIPMVLVLDKENAGLSQIITYLGREIEEELWVESAGLMPEEITSPEVAKRLGESQDTINRYYYPRPIRRIYNYQYIVPLGIRLKQEKYPLHRIVPIWEDVKENMLDVKQAEKMLCELKDYIDNDMIACRETEQLLKINQNQS